VIIIRATRRRLRRRLKFKCDIICLYVVRLCVVEQTDLCEVYSMAREAVK